MTKDILNRRTTTVLIIFLLLLTLFISFFSTRLSSSLISSHLTIVKKENIPLREISGSYLFFNKKKGKNLLYTVGDASSEISISEVNLKEKKISHSYSIDISQKIVDKFAICTSKTIRPCKKIVNSITKQWEAIYVDPLERIFLLNESLATIVIYDAKRNQINHTINLDRFTLEKEKRSAFNSVDSNSLGEGMIPLRNGHVLIAKESNPPALVEFGPKQDKAEGFSSKLILDDNHNFILAEERVKFAPLAVWKLPKDLSSCDLSELSYSKETGLSLLSQRCQAIINIEDLNPENPTVSSKKIWGLPRSLKHSEAFISLANPGDFLVFEDKKSTLVTNSYFLEKTQ